MQRRSFCAGALAAALTATLPARADDAQALLAEADAVRNPEGSFSVQVLLAEYRGGVLAATASMTVYASPAQGSGQFNNLVRFDTPARDAGKLLLRNGIDLWFFDPASRASVRISPKARLLGQASNGDVLSTNLARDYAAQWVGRETVADDTRAPRPSVLLKLVAERADVPYAAVNLWVDEQTKRPLKAQFLTTEGRLLKTAFFRRYEMQLGRERPTETVIVDGLDPQWITVMRSTAYRARRVPQAWLQRDYLPRFTGQDE